MLRQAGITFLKEQLSKLRQRKFIFEQFVDCKCDAFSPFGFRKLGSHVLWQELSKQKASLRSTSDEQGGGVTLLQVWRNREIHGSVYDILD